MLEPKENAAPLGDAAAGYQPDQAVIKLINTFNHVALEKCTPPSNWGATKEDWLKLDLLAGVTKDLLPVVSNPNARISPSSKMREKGKTPSYYKSDRTVVGFGSWTSVEAKGPDIEAWSKEPDYGICIQTREVRALDVDVTDPHQAAEIEAMIDDHIGTHARRGRSNASKFLIAFKLPGELGKRVIKTEHGAIEFLATGQQFIACGTHPSGVRYDWREGTPDEFFEVDLATFNHLWDALGIKFAIEEPSRSRLSAGAIGPYVPGEDPIADYLFAHDHVISEGNNGKLNIVCPWADGHSSDSGESSTTYMHKTADGRGGIFKCLHASCGHRSSTDFEIAIGYTDFEIEQAMAEARRLEQIKENQRIGNEIEQHSFAEPISLAAAEARFVFVASGKRVVDKLNPRHDLALSDWEAKFAGSVEELTQKETIKPDGSRYTPKPKMLPVSRLWLGSMKRISVDQRTFKAGGEELCYDPDGRWAINSWKAVERHEVLPADRERVALFINHINFLFPEHDTRERFLDWLAHIEQRPGVLPHTAWLHIASATGMGRNWLASVLVRIWPGMVASNFNLVHALNSGFNGNLSGKVMAIVDEIREGARDSSWEHGERLKSLINEERRTINPKHGFMSEEFNACRWLMFSNSLSAIPLATNDRRVEVVINDAQPRSAEYYTQLYAATDDRGFINAVACYLRDRNIVRFNPGAHAVLTQEKQRAIATTRSQTLEIAQMIVEKWPSDIITNKALLSCLEDGGHSYPGKGLTAAHRRAVEDAGMETAGSMVKINGVVHRYHIVRNHDQWRGLTGSDIAEEAKRGGAVTDDFGKTGYQLLNDFL